MLKLSYRYDQTSARLKVEGLPDFSRGQQEDSLGIISTWSLELIGSSQVEGKREHLQALMQVVLPYARHQLSGVKRLFGDSSKPVSIGPSKEGGHEITLRSSQDAVKPLKIFLDDAELTDLVRCLDDLRLDPRIQIPWGLSKEAPLPRNELAESVPFLRRIKASLIGTTTFILISVLWMMIPIPPEEPRLNPSNTSGSLLKQLN